MGTEDKHDEILEAAIDLLFTLGPRKVTLEDIAERVGVTKTALYHYFPDKKGLIGAAIRRLVQRYLATLERTLSRTQDPESRLSNVVASRFTFLNRLRKKHPVPIERLLEVDADVMEIKFVIAQSEADMIAGILRQGTADGVFSVDDPELMARTLVACLQGIDQHLLAYPNTNRNAMQGQFMVGVLDGLRVR